MSCEKDLENTEELPVITPAKERAVKHRGHPTLIAFLIGVCIGIGAYFGYKAKLPDITKYIIAKYGEPAIETYAMESTGLSREQVETLIGLVPEEDKDRILAIISKHIDADSLREIKEIAVEQSRHGLITYVSESLDSNERAIISHALSDSLPAIYAKASEYGVTEDGLNSAFPDLLLAEKSGK